MTRTVPCRDMKVKVYGCDAMVGKGNEKNQCRAVTQPVRVLEP